MAASFTSYFTSDNGGFVWHNTILICVATCEGMRELKWNADGWIEFFSALYM